MEDELYGPAVELEPVQHLWDERNGLIEGLRQIATIQEALRASLSDSSRPACRETPKQLLSQLDRAHMAAIAVIDLVHDLLLAPVPFAAWVEHRRGIAHLYLLGELDISTRDRIVLPLKQAVKSVQHEVVIHMELLSFLDCAGVSPMVRLANELSAIGGSVRAVGASRIQKIILSLTPIAFDG